MIITNYLNKYIKLDSPEIKDMMYMHNYDAISITGKINCCGTEVKKDMPTLNEKWLLDLTNEVEQGKTITKMTYQNTATLDVFDDYLMSTIDIGYVNQNCTTNNCTMEDFSSHFVPIFRNTINSIYTNFGYPVSNVQVSFIGNTLIVENLPSLSLVPYSVFSTASGIYTTSPTENRFRFGTLTSPIFTDRTSIFIDPKFFFDDIIKDAVYSFEVEIESTFNGQKIFTKEIGCAFIDINTKCKVATFLNNIVEESKNIIVEKTATAVHIMHYALLNGSNCACNCDELCILYSELVKILDNTKLNDCGC